jgi:hypothetical protein
MLPRHTLPADSKSGDSLANRPSKRALVRRTFGPSVVECTEVHADYGGQQRPARRLPMCVTIEADQ